MRITKRYRVPTGFICVAQGQRGQLEFLSIGDYGKEKNLKADFLGLNQEIDGVPHGPLMPLEKKWVITISSQYGCSMNCNFCDVPKVGPGRNATFDDLVSQVQHGLKLHSEVKHTERLNLHFARMGEPTFNWDVINAATYLAGIFREKQWGFHPVVSTMMPRSNQVREYLRAWMHLKNVILGGNAGLQISVNTTDERRREKIFGGHAMPLEEVSRLTNHFHVVGRKIALNFALSPLYDIDAQILARLFDPEKFLCKLTPMHVTDAALDSRTVSTRSSDGNEFYTKYYPYAPVEERLKTVGFDVIVFVPSVEEDESRITCGNAILSGTKIHPDYLVEEIQ